jgi:hypothetical protein
MSITCKLPKSFNDIGLTTKNILSNISNTSKDRFIPNLTEQLTLKRIVIIDWLFQVTHKLSLSYETLILAIRIFDRVIGLLPKPSENKLYLFSSVSLFIASKYFDLVNITMEVLLTKVGNNRFTKKEVVTTELFILTKLHYKLPHDEVTDFINLFAVTSKAGTTITDYAILIYIVTAMDVSLFYRVNRLTLYASTLHLAAMVVDRNCRLDFSAVNIDMEYMYDIVLLVRENYEMLTNNGSVNYVTKYGVQPLIQRYKSVCRV